MLFFNYLEYSNSNLSMIEYIIQKRYVLRYLFLYHDTYLDVCIVIYRDTRWIFTPLLGTLSKSCILTYQKASLFPVYEQHLWYLWSIWRSRYSSDLLSFITVSLGWHHLCSNISITVIACFFKENIYDVWWRNSWWFSDPGTKVACFLRLQLSQGIVLLHMKLVRAKVCR